MPHPYMPYFVDVSLVCLHINNTEIINRYLLTSIIDQSRDPINEIGFHLGVLGTIDKKFRDFLHFCERLAQRKEHDKGNDQIGHKTFIVPQSMTKPISESP